MMRKVRKSTPLKYLIPPNVGDRPSHQLRTEEDGNEWKPTLPYQLAVHRLYAVSFSIILRRRITLIPTVPLPYDNYMCSATQEVVLTAADYCVWVLGDDVFRKQPGFSPRTCEWNRHALSAYTWTRIIWGHKKMAHHIKKADSPSCTCSEAEETGHQFVFDCPRSERIQAEFVADKSTWEELDNVD